MVHHLHWEAPVSIRIEFPRQILDEALAKPEDNAHGQDQRERLATRILKGRRRRAACFPTIAFADPNWEIILLLYLLACQRQRIDVTGLCAAMEVSKTAVLRRIEALEGLGLIERRRDEKDHRRRFVRLKEGLSRQVEHWLDTELVALRAEGV